MNLRLAPALAAVSFALGVATGPAFAATDRELMERGAWKEARGLVEARFAARPDDAEVLALMSRVKLVYGDRKAALELAEKAVAAEPKNAEYHLYLAEAVGEMAQHASVLKKPGLAKRFKREAEATIALDPKQVEARQHLVMYYIVAPGIMGGDKKKAITVADEIVAVDPVKGNLSHMTRCLEIKDTTAAETYLKKALDLAPQSYDANIAAVGIYGNGTHLNWERVERHALKAREAAPERTGGWVVLAQVYAHEERWSDLDQLLAGAEAKLPNNLTPYYQAGRTILTDGKDMARAEKYFRKYLSEEPEPTAPTHARTHWRLGLVLEKQGRAPEGRVEVEKAVGMDPDLDDAKKDLKRMKRT
jgi:tetratricopeptide (TPR) repeat protein